MPHATASRSFPRGGRLWRAAAAAAAGGESGGWGDAGWLGALVLALLPALLIPAAMHALRARRRRRRRELAARPPPAEWDGVLRESLHIYRRMPESMRPRLLGLMQAFLAEKSFEGCGGLAVTERMRLVVAAQACLLILNKTHDLYPGLSTILIYPASFFAEIDTSIGGHPGRALDERVGESCGRGVVILAWDQVRDDIENWEVGCNVVLHEFSHQLDQEGGEANGVPELEPGMDYGEWKKVMSAEFERLRRADLRGEDTLLDPYGLEGPAEFFSVATEMFFERPGRLRMEHGELYRQLSLYYRLDPAAW